MMTQTSAYPDAADRIVVSSRSGAFFHSAAARLWPWSDWIVLVVTAAALYPMFGRSSDLGPFYGAAARCVLHGEALLTCLPQYPYQPRIAGRNASGIKNKAKQPMQTTYQISLWSVA
jgi:hypothetical protein